jgi:homoserine acetyltransferase
MKYFNGFCLQDELTLFDNILTQDTIKNDYIVCGFSLGAIDAFEYTLTTDTRVDKLILLSPAFFQEIDEKFKKLQLISFSQNPNQYIENFITNIQKPNIMKTQENITKYIKQTTKEKDFEDLKKLLYYVWDIDKLKLLQKRNIIIEVYLGNKDNIINTNNTKDFFMPYCDLFLIQNASHLLKNAK